MIENGATPIFDTLLLEFELDWPGPDKRNEWFDPDEDKDTDATPADP